MKRHGFSYLLLALVLFVPVSQALAVEYTLPDLEGRPHSLEQYRGKWLVVNFWATWCGACQREIPELVDFHTNTGLDAVVVGINFEAIERGHLKQFVEETNIPYTVLATPPVALTPLGTVPALPATFIVNPDGEVVAGEVGIITRNDLEAFIKSQSGSAGR